MMGKEESEVALRKREKDLPASDDCIGGSQRWGRIKPFSWSRGFEWAP